MPLRYALTYKLSMNIFIQTSKRGAVRCDAVLICCNAQCVRV